MLLCSYSAAQSYEWRDVVQQVQLLSNGRVIVDDTRTLWTDEDFGEAFICLNLQPNQRVTLLPGSGALGPGPDARAFTQNCSGGTELVVRNERRVSQRRVRFHYQLEGTIDHYSDVVQWYWIIMEQEHPPVVGYQLTVTAPGAMSEPYDAYVHRFGNREQPTVSLDSDRRTLNVAFDRVPNDDGVEIRWLMDPALFEVRGTQPGFEQLLRDEARIAGVESRLQLRRDPRLGLFPLALLGFMGLGVARQYRRVGREPRVETMKYQFEPPSELPPAAVTTLLSQRFSASSMGAAFHATIMDLMRRGYGEFVQRSRNKFDIQLNMSKSDDGLLPFEVSVLNYLKKAAGRPDGLVTHAKLKSYSTARAAGFMRTWGPAVRKWLVSVMGGELVTQESEKVAKRWAGYSLLAAVVPALMIFLTDRAAMAMMIGGAFLLVMLSIVASYSLVSWRPEIAQEVGEWNSFKRTLTDYTRMKDAPLDFFKLWDVYYAYAAALGVAQQYLKALQRAAPLAGVDEGSMVRSAAWLGASNVSGINTLSGLSNTINSLSSSLSAASVSASSGGSSSGGGGGGGGGSSGGR